VHVYHVGVLKWKRLLIAGLIALPLGVIATAIGDGKEVSGIIRALVSPGIYVGSNLPLSSAGSWLAAVAMAGCTALGVNWLYYSLIFYAAVTSTDRWLRVPGSTIVEP
jgi:hypothetical protein